MKRILLVLPFLVAACDTSPTGPANMSPKAPSFAANVATCMVPVGGTLTAVAKGFDQYGYNRCAGNFNGTYSSWCVAGGAAADCAGIYSPDKLIMKWNAEWDRGNAEGWSHPPYAAWLDNQSNGQKGGSGSVWHYKYQWVGSCGADYTPLADGGYCIWGIFEVVMDQGTDPALGPGHTWFAHAISNGYGN